MKSTIRHNREKQRYELWIDGELVGFAAYQPFETGRAFTHTEIAEGLRGRGFAAQVVTAALDDARSSGTKIWPFCSYVASFIARHPQYIGLVPQESRSRFNLQ